MTAPVLDRDDATRRYLDAMAGLVQAKAKLEKIQATCRQVHEGKLRIPFAHELAEHIEEILEDGES